MAPSASAPPSSAAREAELAIVGAGPVGLYAAYYAGFRGLETIVFDTLTMAGGQIATFYPDTTIYDVAGFPAVTGRELVARLEAQVAPFAIETRLGEEVLSVARAGDRLLLETVRHAKSDDAARAAYAVRAVLVAAGIGTFAPQKIADPEIARFEGRGLHYEEAPAADVRGTTIVVLGGTERAVQIATELAAAGATVTLVHRRERLAVSDESRAALEASSVEFVPFHELTAIAGADHVESVTLTDRRGGGERRIDASQVVACFGFHADATAMRRFGVRLEGNAIAVDSRMASDQPGIYAAGDGATYPGKVRVLAADFGEACTAINNIAAAVIPGAHLFPGYSSHRKGSPRRPR